MTRVSKVKTCWNKIYGLRVRIFCFFNLVFQNYPNAFVLEILAVLLFDSWPYVEEMTFFWIF